MINKWLCYWIKIKLYIFFWVLQLMSLFWFIQLISWLSRAPVISTLNSDIKFAETAYLFSFATEINGSAFVYKSNPDLIITGQDVIWSAEILACLTLASFNEDTYGSVQQSLGRILLVFVDGLEVCFIYKQFL